MLEQIKQRLLPLQEDGATGRIELPGGPASPLLESLGAWKRHKGRRSLWECDQGVACRFFASLNDATPSPPSDAPPSSRSSLCPAAQVPLSAPLSLWPVLMQTSLLPAPIDWPCADLDPSVLSSAAEIASASPLLPGSHVWDLSMQKQMLSMHFALLAVRAQKALTTVQSRVRGILARRDAEQRVLAEEVVHASVSSALVRSRSPSPPSCAVH